MHVIRPSLPNAKRIPPPPRGSKTHMYIYRLSEFLKGAGLKTALVSGPHRAVSVLLHSPEGAAGVAGGRDDVWLMLGVHPQQVSHRRSGVGGRLGRKAAAHKAYRSHPTPKTTGRARGGLRAGAPAPESSSGVCAGLARQPPPHGARGRRYVLSVLFVRGVCVYVCM